MKDLAKYINEKLLIFPSQVNEKLVIFPSQVNEKLVINKNYNAFSTNDEFYEFAKSIMNEISSRKAWKQVDNINQIREILTSSSYKESINEKIKDIIREDDCIFYFACKRTHRRNQWKRMLDWINEHENDMEFLANDTFGNGIYEVRLFETSECVIGLFGNVVSTNPNDGCRIILYA